MTQGEIISEYRKAFGHTSYIELSGSRWLQQRKAFLSAVSGRKVRSKDAGIACVESVLYHNLPCGWREECYARVRRNLDRILGASNA